MSTVGEKLVEGLEQLCDDLKSGKPIPCTTLVRKPELVLGRVRMRDDTLGPLVWFVRKDGAFHLFERALSGPALPESSVEVQPVEPCSRPSPELPSCVKFASQIQFEVKHVPDLKKLPKGLQQLDWKTIEEGQLWEDGSQILVAVPVCGVKKDEWYYELSILAIHCDSEYFAVTCQDEAWGWDLSDVDFYVEL